MFIGVMLIILGKQKTVELTNHDEKAEAFNLWYYAIMATAPIAIILINIPMATLRVLNRVVVPFYMCCISTVVYGIVCIIQYEHFMPSDEEAKVHGRAIFWLLSVVVNGACYNLAWQFKV